MPKTMLGLLHAFPYIRKLALVGSYLDVNGGGDAFCVNDSGENMNYAISTPEKLVSKCTSTLRKLDIHMYEGGIWKVPIDLKITAGDMLVDVLKSIRPITGVNTLRIQLSIHTRMIARHIMAMGNAIVKVSVIHNRHMKWNRTRFNDETDYGDWIRLNCFKAVDESSHQSRVPYSIIIDNVGIWQSGIMPKMLIKKEDIGKSSAKRNTTGSTQRVYIWKMN
ncbi:hypothetical protein F5146DRAFT_994366 [Armillaria mellea]|nr:hypothetical protein F5146DRAFT_994366 [Armillaria mellea]